MKYMITHNMPLQEEGDEGACTYSSKVSQGPCKSKKRNEGTKEKPTKEEEEKPTKEKPVKETKPAYKGGKACQGGIFQGPYKTILPKEI